MPRSFTERLTFGGRVPWAIGLVLTLIVVASFTAAFITRHGTSLFEYGAMVPALVWRGQVWRLATWPFPQPGPVGFLITVLMVFWFGRDVAAEWGSRTYLAVFGTIMLMASVATCLIARVDPAVNASTYLGGYVFTTAAVVAWGLTFPHREILLFFVIRIRGQWLAWLTIFVSVVYAVYLGWQQLLPELFAEAFLLVYLFRDELNESFASKRKVSARKRELAKKRAKSVAYLKLVDKRENELPELPPDIERKLRGKKRDEE